MKLDFKILRVDEENACCALTYKKERYFLEPREQSEDDLFIIRKENGRKLIRCLAPYPSKDYMSYYEYFHSQEFKEEFILNMLEDALFGAQISSVRDYDDEYVVSAH